MQKTRQDSESKFFVKLEKPHFGLIFVLLAGKPQKKIFSKKLSCLNFFS